MKKIKPIYKPKDYFYMLLRLLPSGSLWFFDAKYISKSASESDLGNSNVFSKLISAFADEFYNLEVNAFLSKKESFPEFTEGILLNRWESELGIPDKCDNYIYEYLDLQDKQKLLFSKHTSIYGQNKYFYYSYFSKNNIGIKIVNPIQKDMFRTGGDLNIDTTRVGNRLNSIASRHNLVVYIYENDPKKINFVKCKFNKLSSAHLAINYIEKIGKIINCIGIKTSESFGDFLIGG